MRTMTWHNGRRSKATQTSLRGKMEGNYRSRRNSRALIKLVPFTLPLLKRTARFGHCWEDCYQDLIIAMVFGPMTPPSVWWKASNSMVLVRTNPLELALLNLDRLCIQVQEERPSTWRMGRLNTHWPKLSCQVVSTFAFNTCLMMSLCMYFLLPQLIFNKICSASYHSLSFSGTKPKFSSDVIFAAITWTNH